MERVTKKWFVLLTGALILGFALLVPVQSVFAAAADIKTSWTLADNDANIIDLGLVEAGFNFGIFDIGNDTVSDISEYTKLSLFNTTGDGAHFSITQNGDSWVLTTSDGSSIIDWSSNEVGFYIYNINSEAYYTSYTYTQIGGETNMYTLTFDAGSVMAIDITLTSEQTTPVPSAILLLGSGLVGMVGIRRRRS